LLTLSESIRVWCTGKLTTEGCQSAGGNAEKVGASELQFRPYTRVGSVQENWTVRPTMVLSFNDPRPSNRHHRSDGDCLEGKRENYQVCSVQYCVQQLCTVQCTHMNRSNNSLDWVLSHWAHFSVPRFIFVLCITVCCMHA